MRTFTPPAATQFYCGVDLHARAIFVVVLDAEGQTRFARNLPADPDAFLRAIAPFRDGLLVACECMHCWYWLADVCREQHIDFVLGHAWPESNVGCEHSADFSPKESACRKAKSFQTSLAHWR